MFPQRCLSFLRYIHEWAKAIEEGLCAHLFQLIMHQNQLLLQGSFCWEVREIDVEISRQHLLHIFQAAIVQGLPSIKILNPGMAQQRNGQARAEG